MSRVLNPPLWLSRLVFLATFVYAWHLIALTGWIDQIFIGDPVGIVRFLYEGLFQTHDLLIHISAAISLAERLC